MIIDKNFFPNWKRKSISFTIDDGNLKLDRKFISYVKPAGIRGTFNLCGEEPSPDEFYPAMYEEYEVSNHCKYHPGLYTDELKEYLVEGPLVKGEAGIGHIYHADEKGFYYDKRSDYTIYSADADHYIKCALQGETELVRIFGRKKVRGYVWPFCRMGDDSFLKKLAEAGHFESLRGTNMPEGDDRFNMPKDRLNWCFNALCGELIEAAEEYESLPDDGKMKFFCFGVHSHDFENNNKWDELDDFCKKIGNRDNDFFYGTVHEIFDAEDTVNALEITNEYIYNPSANKAYLTIDGKKIIIEAYSIYYI